MSTVILAAPERQLLSAIVIFVSPPFFKSPRIWFAGVVSFYADGFSYDVSFYFLSGDRRGTFAGHSPNKQDATSRQD
jgi:hypothetical protein